MKSFHTFCFALAFLLCAACAHFESSVSPRAKADPETAILYGRFTLRHTFSAGLKIALWLQNADTQKSVYICFDEAQPFRAIEVKPGRYRILGFLDTNRGHQIRGHHAFPATGLGGRIALAFTAAPGSQTYLGDFTGHATLNDIIENWGVDAITNNFTDTTLEFREKYPNLLKVSAASIFAPSITQP
jgi:hypothetical protein